MIEIDKVKHWTNGVTFDYNAQEQARNTAALPFIFKHIAIMPDVHWGMGATIGSVVPTKGAIIPAAVGVDIGCGMIAVRTSLMAEDLPDNLKPLREEIEWSVPHGRTKKGGSGDEGAWGSYTPMSTETIWKTKLEPKFVEICEVEPAIAQSNNFNHLGTLGGGNHFIEVCLDLKGSVWVMLHSGSRGVGNRIGSLYIAKAKQEMEHAGIGLVDKNLSYLKEGTESFDDYVKAVGWAQEFAYESRQLMMGRVLYALRGYTRPFKLLDKAINCHHNYISEEVHFGEKVFITRKGAVRAGYGDLGIIPGSMGAKSYIVKGLGNVDSFESCAHGAGRVMSRGKAKELITMDQHRKDLEGVECKKDRSVLDESPRAYKDIDAVMNAQKDLVEILYELKQVVCVKG